MRKFCADWRDSCRTRQFNPVQKISAKLRDPELLPIRAKRDAVCHRDAREHGRDRLEIGET